MSQEELDQIMTRLRDLSWDNTLTGMRANFTSGFSMPTHPETEVQSITVDGLAAEWIAGPNSSTDRVILYLHGCGFIVGALAAYRRLAGDLAVAADACVLLLDYCLAPEHPHPAALYIAAPLAAIRRLI